MAEQWFQSTSDIKSFRIFGSKETLLDGSVKADGVIVGGGAGNRGYVYLAQEVNTYKTKNFKVGRTGDPEDREINLQTGNPWELDIKFVEVDDMYATERIVHETFRDRANEDWIRRAPGGTEWYQIDEGNVRRLKNLFTRRTSKKT